jgi:uncharacterized protein (DUF2236 family)
VIDHPLKVLIRRRVTAAFNDATRGEKPVTRRDTALFPPDSVAWRVHGDVVTMLIGGVASLLLQMLHPRVLAGVWDHSNFRADMHGRLRSTAKFIATSTFGDAELGRAAIARVNAIHAKIGGVLPDGTPYSALDPELLAWVHVTETWSFLSSWIRYGQPDMPVGDQDAYFVEMVRVAEALGTDPIPRTRAEAEALIEAMRPQLLADHRTHEVSRLVLTQRVGGPAVAIPSKVVMAAAVDLLPDWARRMHGLEAAGLALPVFRGGAMAMARTLRWAFDGSPNRRIHPAGEEMRG